jgi:hypothetical protein
MAKPQRRHEIARVFAPRQGEGALLSVEMRTDARADGTTITGIAFDISQAPVPDRQYAANVADVVYQDDGILLMVGQKKLRSEELRSLLLIPMPVDKAEQFLESVDRMPQPSLDEILKATNTRRGSVTSISREPEQTYVLPANIVGVAVSGAETCMDLYHVSSFSILAVKGGSGKLAVNPVVRLLMHTGLFFAIVERLRAVVNEHGVQSK